MSFIGKLREKRDRAKNEIEVYPVVLNNEEVMEHDLDEFRELIEELHYEGIHVNLPNIDVVFGSEFDRQTAYMKFKEIFDFVSIPVQKAYTDKRCLRSNNLDKL